MFDWDDSRHTLDHPLMDATHGEFLRLCRELEAAPDEEWPARLMVLVSHTQAHFAEEERLMRPGNFASRQEHESEHKRLLGEAASMQASLARGRTLFAKAWLKNLPIWFAIHLATMDSALAAHLKKSAQ